MILSRFITELRQFTRTLPRSSMLKLAVLPGLILTAQAGDEAVVTNVGRFEIPFEVEAEAGKPVEGFAVLFGSKDGGVNWDQLQSVPASQQAFIFNAPRDGHYAFAIRVTDALGNLPPQAMQGAIPELEVVVDTVAPQLRLDLFDSGPGKVLINWSCTDPSADPSSLAIEVLNAGDGRWKPAQFQAAASGQTMITAAAGSAISVRAVISDTAGNQAQASAQHVSRGGSQGGIAHGAPPAVSPAAPGAPLGPNPFFNAPPGSPVGETGAVVSAQVPADPVYPQMLPAPPVSGMAPDTTFTNPVSESSSEPQILNSTIFDVDYEVRDIGPSGVSSVELFVTEDGGQQWFRYGNDADLKSPVQVDTRGEGTFGFAVRVRNGLGFADPPPQPGQAPEIVVTVDTTAPAIEFAQPALRADGLGTIQLIWRVADAHASLTPVRLEQATTPAGPWTPVFDWQADRGGFQWAVRTGTPPALYFRVLARDAAGNVSASQTPQPVMVDTRKPVGRLLRVQAASHSAVQLQ